MFNHLPFKVVALVILEIIIGIIMLLEGLTLILLEGFSGIIVAPSYQINLFLKVIYVSTGLLSFVIAYGLWKGKSWSWRTGFFFAFIGAIVNFIHLIGVQHHIGIIPFILNAVLIYYLTRPQILEYYHIRSRKDSTRAMREHPPL
ncbi:hypothetical protein [[Eubacterium] cellulosolvens]